MKKVIVSIISLMMLGLSIYFGVKAYMEYKPLAESKEENAYIRDVAIKEISFTDDDGINRNTQKVDFKTLKGINEDIVGWITIPNTSVDYPILVGSTDEEYLFKNFEGDYSKLGSIFSYSNTSKTLSDARTVLFGHNMRQLQMFGELKKYLDVDYRQNHGKMYIFTEKRTYEAELFSMFICSSDEKVFGVEYELGTAEYQDFLVNMSSRNQYKDISKSDILDYYNNQTFTLVTCSGSAGSSNRLVLNWVVVSEEYILG